MAHLVRSEHRHIGGTLEHKNTAILGALGASGQDGFGVDPNTREIRIFDKEGEVVYAKRARDTSASADSHIKAAGYSRVGDWVDGIAPLERRNWLQRAWPTILGISIPLMLFAGCQAAMSGSSGKDEPEQYDAIYYCKEFVKDKLKAPSTAKFSNESASGSGSSWTSTGIVESQNSFGGMVQTRYSCDLTYSSSDESWRAQVLLD